TGKISSSYHANPRFLTPVVPRCPHIVQLSEHRPSGDRGPLVDSSAERRSGVDPLTYHLRPRPHGRGLRALIVALGLVSSAAVRADTLYKIQPIFKVGDKVGDVQT